MENWGRQPEYIKQQLHSKGWFSLKKLQMLLSGKGLPYRIALKPPSGKQALEDLPRFNAFLNSWRQWTEQAQLEWRVVDYRQLGAKRIPVQFTLRTLDDVILVGGKSFSTQLKHIQERLDLFSSWPELRPALINKISSLEKMTIEEVVSLARILPQLISKTGNGMYMRSYPLQGADTKFIEKHTQILIALLNDLHVLELKDITGLCLWLGCRPKPNNWLTIRPLCATCSKDLSNFPVFKIPAEHYQSNPLPAQRILIVENEETLFSLPPLRGCVAIGGGGNNLASLDASWLDSVSQVAYWGDLDTWGLNILAKARIKRPDIHALMMDNDTLNTHLDCLVEEVMPADLPPFGLTNSELDVFGRLQQLSPKNRLEQERLKQDYVTHNLTNWINGTSG